MPLSDEQLVATYLQGDEKALSVLFERRLKPTYGFIFSFVKNTADTSDITQEVFVKAWRHLKKFDQARNFKNWLLTIAKNSALDFLKKKKAVTFSELSGDNGDDFTENLADPTILFNQLEHVEIARAIEAGVGKLPERSRQVLRWHYQEGCTFRQIADFLAAPINTVKSWHRRALATLRKNFFEKNGKRGV